MDCCGRENTTADSCFSVPLVLNYKSDFIPPQQELQRLPFVTGIKSKLSLKDPMYDLAGPSPSLVAPCDSPMLSQPQATWPSFPTQALGRLWTPLQGSALWRPLAPAFCRAAAFSGPPRLVHAITCLDPSVSPFCFLGRLLSSKMKLSVIPCVLFSSCPLL